MAQPEERPRSSSYVVTMPDAHGVDSGVRVGVAILDGDLRFVMVNAVLAAWNGLSVDAHPGRRVDEVGFAAPPLMEILNRVLETALPIENVLVHRPADHGSLRAEFVLAVYPRRVAAGVDGLLVVVTDISMPALLADRVRRQARRAELLADFHAAASHVLDEREILKIAAECLVSLDRDSCMIGLVSDDGRFLEPAVVASGREEHAAFGREVVALGREPIDMAMDAHVLRSGEPLFESDATRATKLRMLDGMPEFGRERARRYGLRSLISVPLNVGGEAIGTIRLFRIGDTQPPFEREDLEFVQGLAERVGLAAERSRTHRALAETAATLGAVLRASPLATAVLDPEDRILIWNAAAEALFGYTEAEVVGRQTPFVATSAEEVEEIKSRMAAGEVVAGLETKRYRKDGTPVDVAVYASSFFDAQGLKGNVIRFDDIRQRKQLEAELLQSQKIESVGRLAGGVAHDFNNILTAIIGYADLGLADLADGSLQEAERDLESIKASAQRAAGLTQQLLAFSRRQVLVPEVVDANQIVNGMESMLRRLIGEHIDLRIELDEGAGSLKADPTQLQQVILNLALNARDAMPAGGELRIATGRTHFDEAVASQHLELVPGDYVMISVSDTGTGMDDKTKERIFEPFFTTKERGKGTGLGLATTYGIVRQSEGHVWVSSEVGKGSEFTLYFPACDDPRPLAETPEPFARTAHHERILLVEDEPALRGLAQLVLLRQGYSLLVASNAAEALATLEADPTVSVDLLVTDVVMPGLSGPELARALRATAPSLRVLLVSGYSEEMVSKAGDVADAAFLAKPFTPEMLLRKVAEVLADGPTPAAAPAPPAPGRREAPNATFLRPGALTAE